MEPGDGFFAVWNVFAAKYDPLQPKYDPLSSKYDPLRPKYNPQRKKYDSQAESAASAFHGLGIQLIVERIFPETGSIFI